MMLKSKVELDNTRKKLCRLEKMYEEARADFDGDPDVREAELQSIMRMINQLKEEIARYEAHQPAAG